METVQTMNATISVSLQNLSSYFRESYSGIDRENGALLLSRCTAGASLFVFLPPLGVGRCFFPEFDRVWWRNAWRWARNFGNIEELASEIKGIRPQGKYPFFCTATARLDRWSPIVSRGNPSIEDHYEILVPNSEEAERQVEQFMYEWTSSFVALDIDYDRIDASCQRFMDAKSPLLYLPAASEAGRSIGLARGLADELAQILSRGHPNSGALPGVVPNINEFMLPAGLERNERASWGQVIDLRVEWMCRFPSPLFYLPVQELLSKNQFAREFVWEWDPSKCRGVPLIGSQRCLRLYELGLLLESDYPILGQEGFRSTQ